MGLSSRFILMVIVSAAVHAQTTGWSYCPGYDGSKIRIQSILETVPMKYLQPYQIKVGVVPLVNIVHSGIYLKIESAVSGWGCPVASSFTDMKSSPQKPSTTPIGAVSWHTLNANLVIPCPTTFKISILVIETGVKAITCMTRLKTVL